MVRDKRISAASARVDGIRSPALSVPSDIWRRNRSHSLRPGVATLGRLLNWSTEIHENWLWPLCQSGRTVLLFLSQPTRPLAMYIPPHFAETRPEELHRIVRAHPLGALVRSGPGGLDADHIPFELDVGHGTPGRLTAHVARANPLLQQCPSGTPVMVIFRGAEAYVSPNWYPSKHEAHRQVPTWNYEVVHVHGLLTVHDDERFVRGLVARLTRHHESTEPTPWKMGDSSPGFIDEMLAKIAGIAVEITSINGKVKLSQNKEARDRINAARMLENRGSAELAASMRRTV